jgi:molecular chaperone DnaJ
MAKKDYYETLGIDRSANSGEIKKAFLKLAKKYHPDTNTADSGLEQKFKEINEAYDVLKDPQKKAAYDQLGHSAFENGSSGGFGQRQHGGFSEAGPDVNDIFGDFFSDFMGSRGRTRSRSTQSKGSDLKYNLDISLEEAFNGVDKKIHFTTDAKCTPCTGKGSKEPNSTTICSQCGGHGVVRMQQGFFAVEQTCNKCSGQGQIIKNPCSTCHGTGRQQKNKNLVINVPSGVEDGMRIRVAGEGEAGLRGGQVGDLYVFVKIKPHDIYKVEKDNLHFKLPLKFTKAALGGESEVPTIDGKKVLLKVPAGTETGDKLRLKGKGMSRVRSAARGDLYAHVYVETPKSLTKKQKSLLEELDKELGETNINYKDEGFFSKFKNIWS